MPQTIITSITSKETVYSIGRTANMVLSDLQAKILKQKIVTRVFNKNTQKRGFSSLFNKSFINSF